MQNSIFVRTWQTVIVKAEYESSTRNGLIPHQPVSRDFAVHGPKWIWQSGVASFEPIDLPSAITGVGAILRKNGQNHPKSAPKTVPKYGGVSD